MKNIISALAFLLIAVPVSAIEVGSSMPNIKKSSASYQGVYTCYGKVVQAYRFNIKGAAVLGLYKINKGWFAYIVSTKKGDVFVGDANYDGITDVIQTINASLFLRGCVKLEGA